MLFFHNIYLDTAVNVRYLEDGHIKENVVYAHKLLLTQSPYFTSILQKHPQLENIYVVDVDTTAVEDGLNAFNGFLGFLYTQQIDISCANVNSLLYLANLFQMTAFEEEVRKQQIAKANMLATFMASLVLSPTNTLTNNHFVTQLLNPGATACIQLQTQLALLQRELAMNEVMCKVPSLVDDAKNVSLSPPFGNTTHREMSPLTSGSCSSATASPFDTASTQDSAKEKEAGWCRNKKFIETLKKGYRCTVCNKVYGRYNSVSYHVTIYHRNPPIQCDEPGCNFTTREARYIHFHKYYKHQVPLPDTIDLGSRKCPFASCSHVSKSPAMLEKHLVRHVAECSENGSQRYKCQECDFVTHCQRDMMPHFKEHHARLLQVQQPSVSVFTKPITVCVA